MPLPIDSRQYIIAYPIHSRAECPADFSLPAGLGDFEAGLFLPRDDPDWFGRSSYPARLLLLTRENLHVVPHPTSNEPPSEFRLDDISSVESGHMLLKGWLRFAGRRFDCKVPYNTRGHPAVFEFMRRFRKNFLGASQLSPAREIRLGAGLDIKFSNAVAGELDKSECPLALLFQPPGEFRSRRWFLPRRRWIPGDVLVSTARRLLWITDRDRVWRSRFGAIASYAPLRALRAIGMESEETGPVMRVSLSGGCEWEIPLQPENVKDAEEFVAIASVQKI